MHAASGGHTPSQAKVRKFWWCLYNINAYVCNLEIKLKWNELLCSLEIVNRDFESKECFSAASCKVLCEFLTKAKILVMCDFHSTLCLSLLWKHSCVFLLMVLFLRSIITDWQDENKRTEKLGSQIWANLSSLYRNKFLRLAGEKSVLASGSNLSLATGLASWKVSLEPWLGKKYDCEGDFHSELSLWIVWISLANVTVNFTFLLVAVVISRDRLVVRCHFRSFMSPFQSCGARPNLP